MTDKELLELAKEHDMIDSRGNWSFDLLPFARAVHEKTREECAAAIKTEDDYCVTEGDYMLDSDDCIRVINGTWVRPEFA